MVIATGQIEADEDKTAAGPLLSVITVCLNRATLIETALTSVARQSRPDIEHIVIDGQSTDGTLDVISQFPEIRVISEPDKGLYDAMNKGLNLARGRYVVLLNSDDELEAGVFDSVLPHMDGNTDVICVGADFVELKPDGIREVLWRVDKPQAIKLSVSTAALGFSLVNAKFFRRRFLLERVGLFNLSYKLASDVDLLLRAALAAPSLKIIPAIGYRYLQHEGSLTINASGSNPLPGATEGIAIATTALHGSGLSIQHRFYLHCMRARRAFKSAYFVRRGNTLAAMLSVARQYPIDAACWMWFHLGQKLTRPERRVGALFMMRDYSN